LWKWRYESFWTSKGISTATNARHQVFSCIFQKEEQRRRFLKRIDTPEKNWKFSRDDIEERKYWKDYMKAYEAVDGHEH